MLTILIKSHTRHSGNTFATLSDFKDRYFLTPYGYMRASGMLSRVCVKDCVYERRLAYRYISYQHPHERTKLIMHSLFYQYPEYRVRHVPRVGLKGARNHSARLLADARTTALHDCYSQVDWLGVRKGREGWEGGREETRGRERGRERERQEGWNEFMAEAYNPRLMASSFRNCSTM